MAHFGSIALALVLAARLADPGMALADDVLLATVSGPTPYASCTLGGPGTVYDNAEVEPDLAVNPTTAGTSHLNLIGVWQQDRWTTGGAHGLVAGSSFDGGRTWKETALPFDSCAPGGIGYGRASDPWISIGPNGTAYAVAIAISHDLKASAVIVATSGDGGQTWGNIRTLKADDGLPPANAFNDKESVTADPRRPGVAYAVWDRVRSADNTQPAWFTRTSNGGRSWEPARVIVPSYGHGTGTIGNQIVVDRGTLIDIFDLTLRHFSKRTVCSTTNGRRRCRTVRKAVRKRYDNYIAEVRSRDGGTTWSKYHIIATQRSIGVQDANGSYVRTGGGLPAVAVGPRHGKLFVVWQDSRFTSGALDQVAIVSSADGGSHWTAPRAVSQRQVPGFTPAVAVDAKGMVAVTYYDLRHNTGQTNALQTDYWLTTSRDGGRTFNHEVHLGGPFNLRLAPDAGGYFLGDYQGLAAAGTVFYPFFVMVNDSTPGNSTDVFTTQVAE